MSLIKDPSGETILVTIRVKKHELAVCLRRMPQHGTIHDSVYNAFSFGLFAAYELESEDRELLQKLISEWRSQYRRPNDPRLIESDEELIDDYYGTKEPDVIQ